MRVLQRKSKNPLVSPRTLRVIFLLLILGSASARATELSITRVFTGWRDASSFKRISEYFTGRENSGGTLIRRTQPDQRSGYYFLVRVENAGVSLPVKLEVELILPNTIPARIHTFSAELKSGKNVVNLGLTGADWPSVETNPVAWKINLLGPAGEVLATEKSYLWEKPAQ